MFSYFNPPITTKKPFDETSLEKVYQMVAGDESLRKLTLAIRSGEKDKQDVLPFITPSGLFKGRKLTELVTYTGILCIDLDKVPDMFTAEKIKADTRFRPALLFISPSGNGIKIFYRISNAVREDHLLYFKAFSHYFLQTYGQLPDEKCKDITRPCFLCHDPNAYYSPASAVDSEQLLAICSEICKPVEKRTQYETKSEFGSIISAIKSSPVVHARAVQDLKNAGWKNHSDNYWTRPGKERGTSGEYKREDGFYKFRNYSTSAMLDTAVNYDDIDLIAFFEFNGDNSKCIKALAYGLGLSFDSNVDRVSCNSSLIREIRTNENSQEHDEDYFNDNDITTVLDEGSRAKEQRKIGGAFLYEDTTTYIFSRTNYGKSLLVFQLAYAAATGTSIADCSALQNSCEPMKVLVVDLELEPRVLFNRHGLVLQKEEPLLKNLRYLHEKMDKSVSTGLNLLDKIERYALKHKAQLVIIDNISKLLPDSLKPEVVTQVIDALNKIRKRTGASMLVIGHTIKGNPKVAIQPTDYFGSSMVQNFFAEVSFLDMTSDGRFFLCQSKTKQKECFTETVPVFTRGEHPVVGVGFNYQALLNLSDIQLPYMLQTKPGKSRRNLNNYKKEISILDSAGVNRKTIAEMLDVSRQSIYRIFEAS